MFLGLPVSGSRALAYLFFIREGCSCNMFACPFLTDLGNPVTAPLLIRLFKGHTTEKSLSLNINFRTILTFLTPCPLYIGWLPTRPPAIPSSVFCPVCYPLSSAAGWRMLLVETPSMPARELHTINKPCPCSHAQYKNTRQRLLLQMKTKS